MKKCSLRDQLKENHIKIQNTNLSLDYSNLNLVLKISGFWETQYEIGLTYRFFICEDIYPSVTFLLTIILIFIVITPRM